MAHFDLQDAQLQAHSNTTYSRAGCLPVLEHTLSKQVVPDEPTHASTLLIAFCKMPRIAAPTCGACAHTTVSQINIPTMF